MLEKLGSRKLLLCIAACVSAATAAYSGSITWAQAIDAIIAAVGIYTAANTAQKFAAK
jgi:type IV secretory pathway VirB2 component (pilin)